MMHHTSKGIFKYRALYIVVLMLLISACSPRIVEKTSKTTTRQVDSVVTVAEQESIFRTVMPEAYDSIILIDRKTGVKVKIKEYSSAELIDFLNNYNEEDPAIKKIKIAEIKSKKVYEIEVFDPEKKIPIKITETVIEENKTITKTKTAWYYRWSLNFVIFLFAAAILIFLIKKQPWQLLKR